MNYFQPERGTMYGLKSYYDSSNYYFVLIDDTVADNDNLRGSGSFQYDSYVSIWQLMPVGTNTFIIANQQTGQVLDIEQGSGYKYCTAKDLNDDTPTITAIQGSNGRYAFYIPNYDAYICPVKSGFGFLRVVTKSSANAAAVWQIDDTNGYNWQSFSVPNPKFTLPDLPAIESTNKPVFDSNGNAPVITPTSLGKSIYIPFCFINDSLSPSQAVQDSPYYLLQQYEQYYQASCVENETAGTITLVDTWEYGSSESKSRNFTQEFGIKVGFNMTENEFIAKENESITASVDLGFQEGNTSTSSETMSKEVRVEVLPNNKLALYGVTTSYKLFRLSDTTNVANQQNPTAVSQMDNYSKMANKFLTITYALT